MPGRSQAAEIWSPSEFSVIAIAARPTTLTPAPVVTIRMPNLLYSREPNIETVANTMASGPKVRPARSGVMPSPDCSVRVSANMNDPKKAMKAKFTASPALNERLRNRARSSSGSPARLVRRRSHSRVAASTGTEEASMAQVQAGQPSLRPRIIGTRASPRPEDRPNAPTGSRRGRRAPLACGTSFTEMRSAAAAIGTLTRKMARQPRPNTFALSSSPPSTWPATEASPTTAPNRTSPWRARSPGTRR